ncbi:MAG: hypothetical protein IJJ15_07970 [Ruminococcus sp.]|nr:hypothetical protein [Ruminococcus sp.]
MKNPFAKWKKSKDNTQDQISEIPQESIPDVSSDGQTAKETNPDDKETKPQDSFVEWCRTQVRGGIERRERNDIFEAYSVFGTDEDHHLVYRYYHRYPEYEKEFSLSFSRNLTFEEFNRRLLSELDRNDLKLNDYSSCITQAEHVLDQQATQTEDINELTEADASVLKEFCEAADILQNKSYLHNNGVLRCECESVIGDEKINIWFRRPILHDSVEAEISGVTKEPIEGYDIDNLWIMGLYNRLRERCQKVCVWRLTSEWSIEKESLYLFSAEDVSGTGIGTILIAAGSAESFRRFGFYSLDFSRK